jgi:hypothetical protein
MLLVNEPSPPQRERLSANLASSLAYTFATRSIGEYECRADGVA